MFWSALIHLGYNLNLDRAGVHEDKLAARNAPADYFRWAPHLRLDDAVWRTVTQAAADAGVNSLVLGLADGIAYESHPEIAVEGAWSTTRLTEELARLRELGIEPLPKLNFAAGHDVWLGKYSRMVSSAPYYEVAADLIAEVCELFDRPALFHIGMDEEDFELQSLYELAVVRQHELWWHDLDFFAGQVRRGGSRPWMWSDAAWTKAREYYDRMDHDIVQSNWHYDNVFAGDETGRPKTLSHQRQDTYQAYLDLDEHGFEQIPAASTFFTSGNLRATAQFARERLDPNRLLGFLHTTWLPLLPGHLSTHLRSIDEIAEARQAWEGPSA